MGGIVLTDANVNKAFAWRTGSSSKEERHSNNGTVLFMHRVEPSDNITLESVSCQSEIYKSANRGGTCRSCRPCRTHLLLNRSVN
jgi:hypothetical protein